MPEEKGLGKKILGLFVETDESAAKPEAVEAGEQGEKSAAEIVAELAGQSATKPAASPAGTAPPLARAEPLPRPTGPVEPIAIDFDAFFKSAGIDPTELDRVRKAEELLKSLPDATPVEVRKQIVEASLKAFGFDVAKIVAAAQSQLKGLSTYARNADQQGHKAVTDAKAEISKLDERIIELKVQIDKRLAQTAGQTAAAEQRRAQVQKILDFFGAPAAAAEPPKPT